MVAQFGHHRLVIGRQDFQRDLIVLAEDALGAGTEMGTQFFQEGMGNSIMIRPQRAMVLVRRIFFISCSTP